MISLLWACQLMIQCYWVNLDHSRLFIVMHLCTYMYVRPIQEQIPPGVASFCVLTLFRLLFWEVENQLSAETHQNDKNVKPSQERSLSDVKVSPSVWTVYLGPRRRRCLLSFLSLSNSKTFGAERNGKPPSWSYVAFGVFALSRPAFVRHRVSTNLDTHLLFVSFCSNKSPARLTPHECNCVG